MPPETIDQSNAQFDSLDFSLKCGDPVVSPIHFMK
jgi:DNA replication ATP-dependent helicase Dna2